MLKTSHRTEYFTILCNTPQSRRLVWNWGRFTNSWRWRFQRGRVRSAASAKKYFHLGRMALSEWTGSVSAVRDTLVGNYSAPGLNTMRCVAHRPPIADLPFPLPLSVSYFKWTLWRCGQLRSYLGMGSLGTRLGWDCNAMGDVAKISPRVPSNCAQNAILSLSIIHIIPSRQIYVAIDNPSRVPAISCLTTSSYLWNYVRIADDVSHAENLQSNGCRCFSQLYKFWDGIQVTRVLRYPGERQC